MLLQRIILQAERCVALKTSKYFEHVQFRHFIQRISVKAARNNELLCVLSVTCLYKNSEHLFFVMEIKSVVRLFVQIHFHCFLEHVKTQYKCENSGFAGKFFLGLCMWMSDK